MTLITYMGRNHYHEPLPNWLEEMTSTKNILHWILIKRLILHRSANYSWHLDSSRDKRKGKHHKFIMGK